MSFGLGREGGDRPHRLPAIYGAVRPVLMRHGMPVQPSERSMGSGLSGARKGRDCRALWSVAG